MNRSQQVFCTCVAALALAGSAAAQGPRAESAEGTGLFSRASPSVVLLTVYDANGTPLRQGSAFVVDGAGILATSAEVVADAAIVEVRTADGSTHSASALLASAPDTDLALLRTEGSAYPALPLADGDAPAAGTPVHVVGNAVQLRNALFSGVVIGTRTNSRGATMLEISNQLYPVTNGSPLLATDGRVLGVAIFAAERVQDVNLAAPVQALRALLTVTRGARPERVLATLSNEMRARVEGATALRSKVLSECTPSDIVNTDRVLKETLLVGAPLQDAGNSTAAFKLYEGASYKLLYLLGDRCPSVTTALNDAIAATAQDDAASQKAAVVRYAFDAILGVPAEGPPAPEL